MSKIVTVILALCCLSAILEVQCINETFGETTPYILYQESVTVGYSLWQKKTYVLKYPAANSVSITKFQSKKSKIHKKLYIFLCNYSIITESSKELLIQITNVSEME